MHRNCHLFSCFLYCYIVHYFGRTNDDDDDDDDDNVVVDDDDDDDYDGVKLSDVQYLLTYLQTCTSLLN